MEVACKTTYHDRRECYSYSIKLGKKWKLVYLINNWAEDGVIVPYSEDKLKDEWAYYWDVKRPEIDADFARWCKERGIKPKTERIQ